MDGINNTPQTQVVHNTNTSTQDISTSSNSSSSVSSSIQATKQATIKMQQNDVQNNLNADTTNQNVNNTTITSENEVKELVNDLNDTLSPMRTDIEFGVDQDNVFYVAAVDTKTHQVIRRFPAEEAQSLLPKMQEVTGILFDSKG